MASAPIAKNWKVEDLIDFDFALNNEAKSGDAETEHREILLQYAAECDLCVAQIDEDHKASAFRYWLQKQRNKAHSEALPGALFVQGLRWIRMFLIFFAIASGSLLTAALLQYDGAEPINVAGFLCLLLGGQILLLTFSLGTLLLRNFGILKCENGLLGPFLRQGLMRMLYWMQRKILDSNTAQTHLQQTFLGTMNRNPSQQIIVMGILFRLTQSFGIAFNLAAISVTLLLVAVSDRAFGWQSTLNLSADAVHRMTRRIASPWASFYPAGSPSREEIAGSRIFLKDGIKTLTNQNLASWWRFLVCSLMTYGLLPRLILWMMSCFFVKHRLAHMHFDSLICDRLWQNMLTQKLHTEGIPAQFESPQITPFTAVSKLISLPEKPECTSFLLVDPELMQRLDRDKIEQSIRDQFGWIVSRWLCLPDENQTWDDFQKHLTTLSKEDCSNRILILQDAFQVPVGESLDCLRKLRKTQGSQGKTIVSMIASSQMGEQHERYKVNQKVWERSIESLGDSHLGFVPLCINDP